MPYFNSYNDDNPPSGGNAAKIYRVFKLHGLKVHDLHYNANCWMKNMHDGWATWACVISGNELGYSEFWCGISNSGDVYIQSSSAPFNVVWLKAQP